LIGLALLLALGVDRAEIEKLKKAGVNPLVERGLMSE